MGKACRFVAKACRNFGKISFSHPKSGLVHLRVGIYFRLRDAVGHMVTFVANTALRARYSGATAQDAFVCTLPLKPSTELKRPLIPLFNSILTGDRRNDRLSTLKALAEITVLL